VLQPAAWADGEVVMDLTRRAGEAAAAHQAIHITCGWHRCPC